MVLSYVLITAMVDVLGLNVYVSKLIAETGLFAASFALQNLVVFSARHQAKPAAE
jgi:putative flippase GtrA